MNTCWKCGGQLIDMWCPSCDNDAGPDLSNMIKLDMTKITTFHELLEVLNLLEIRIGPEHPIIKRFPHLLDE